MEYLKNSALIFGVILAIVLIWYSVSRIRAVNTPLSVYSFKEHITEKDSYEIDKLKFTSYNIAHGRGGEHDSKNWSHKTEKELLTHLDRIAEQIITEHPDIILLNETDFSSVWSFNINQAEYIGKKCGYPYILEQKNMVISFPFYHLSFGNAILSRYPIQNEKFIDFQPYSKLEDIFVGNHDAFFCELKLPFGSVGIFGIHFEYRSESIRVRCAELIAEMCSETEFPIIVLGDFNSTPSGLPKSSISENGKNAMSFLLDEKGFTSYIKEKNAYTFPSEKPDRLIDWIIGKGILKFSNSKIIKSDLSDHLMVVTEIEFNNQR